MSSTETERYRERNLWRLAFAVLGAELAWAAHLLIVYALSPSLCNAGLVWVLHLITAAALIVAGAAVGLAARGWWDLRTSEEAELTLRDDRTRFLLSQGLFLGVLMIFGIIAAEIAIVIAWCV